MVTKTVAYFRIKNLFSESLEIYFNWDNGSVSKGGSLSKLCVFNMCDNYIKLCLCVFKYHDLG